jgi:hypothetical protein
VSEIRREAGHLRLICVADEERRTAGQHRHGRDDRIVSDVTNHCDHVADAAYSRRRRGLLAAKSRSIRRFPQPQREREINQRVAEQRVSWTHRKQESAADCGAEEHAQIAAGGIETHRALQTVATDDIVQQQLRWSRPQHSGDPVRNEQRCGMPQLQRIREDQHSPRERHQYENHHAALNETPRVDALREGTDRHGKEQERQPVSNDCKAAERRRLEVLKDHPVGDHVLDVVGHHGQHAAGQEWTKARVAQRDERIGHWRQ